MRHAPASAVFDLERAWPLEAATPVMKEPSCWRPRQASKLPKWHPGLSSSGLSPSGHQVGRMGRFPQTGARAVSTSWRADTRGLERAGRALAAGVGVGERGTDRGGRVEQHSRGVNPVQGAAARQRRAGERRKGGKDVEVREESPRRALSRHRARTRDG